MWDDCAGRGRRKITGCYSEERDATAYVPVGFHCESFRPGFAAKLNSTGSAPQYSTLLPFVPAAAALDTDGNAYLATLDEVMKLDAAGATALFRTKLPLASCGGADDDLSAIAVDSLRNVLLAGGTTCPSMPATNGAFQPVHGASEVCPFEVTRRRWSRAHRLSF